MECFGEHFEVPEVVRCSDNHFRRAIYSIGPYIADYPEQVLMASVVGNWCVRYVSLSFCYMLPSLTDVQVHG